MSFVALVVWIVECIAIGQPIEVVDVGSGYVSVYAVQGAEGVVLVDAHNPGREGRIVDSLERVGIDPDRVTLVLLTHVHPDHAGSAAALRELLDVPIAVGAGDVDLARTGRIERFPHTGRRGRLIAPFLGRRWAPFDADVVVEGVLDLAPYGVDGQARVVGGHTPGSLVVELPGGSVLTGDLIRGRLERRGVPTLHFFHVDGVEAHAQLRSLLDDPTVTTLLPAHGHPMPASDVRDWLDDRGPRHHRRLQSLAAP